MDILCKKCHRPTKWFHSFVVLEASCITRRLAMGEFHILELYRQKLLPEFINRLEEIDA